MNEIQHTMLKQKCVFCQHNVWRRAYCVFQYILTMAVIIACIALLDYTINLSILLGRPFRFFSLGFKMKKTAVNFLLQVLFKALKNKFY